ncbi:MAG: hypothetical protein WCE46_00185 [Methanoregula sp.]|uniref:hypothetical protein n=1 Tax=Methanoregula sp. TaxID=2052170 RepID=UPI003C738E9C
MSKIFGFRPQAATQQLIDKFEKEVLIRHNNQQLVGTVYIDMQDDRWAVAVAYNYTRKPGLHGHENPLEVRYSYPVQENTGVQMFRSDSASEKALKTEPLKDRDAFIRFALMQECSIVGRAA